MLGLRGCCFTLAAFFAFILAIVADVVNIASLTIQGTTTWFTLWSSPGVNPEQSGYGDIDNMIRAARAFVILTILFTFPSILIGAVDMMDRRVDCLSGAPANFTFKILMLGAAIINLLWSTIAWPILFALPQALKSDVQNQLPAGSPSISVAYNASPIVMLLAWCFIICMLVVVFVFPEPIEQPPTNPTKQDPQMPGTWPEAAPQPGANNARDPNALRAAPTEPLSPDAAPQPAANSDNRGGHVGTGAASPTGPAAFPHQPAANAPH